MPHATTNGNMSQPMTNGDSTTQSKFLSHLNSYPVVSDSVETFKSNPYGRKSLDLANDTYQRFGKPVEPYLETPYSYAKPYVAKADELADSGLGRVETHFPIVKQDTNTIVDKGKSIVWFPFKLADDGKTYLVNTWQDEYNKTASHKNRGAGFQTLLMALISTELKIASDFFQVIADILGPKYEESKQTASDYAKHAQKTANQYVDAGKEKVHEFQKKGDDYLRDAQKQGQEVSKQAQEKAGEYQKKGEEKGEQVKEQAQQTKNDAKAKAQK